MHRKATDVELLQDTDTKYINADGTIFKGLYEILKESGDTCKDAGGKQMVKECSKARRQAMGCVPDSMCTKNSRCCLQNTLRWRKDFAAQKCRLEQTCESVGVKFLMLMICHPECNPIEGDLYVYCYNICLINPNIFAIRLLELHEEVQSGNV